MTVETTKLSFVEGAAASTPSASRAVIYAKADGLMYSKDDAGAETLMSSGSVGSVATDPIWDAKGDLAGGTGANTAVRLAVGTNGKVLMAASGETTGLKWEWPGAIVQVKTANLSTDHSTTAATLQDAGLSLAFTPLFTDSILRVEVQGECNVSRVAGTLIERFQWVSITNTTDAVELVRQVRGGRVTSSADLGTHFNSIALVGFYTVNSLTARTFKLQHMAGVVTNVESTITGSRTGGVTMIISEVRP